MDLGQTDRRDRDEHLVEGVHERPAHQYVAGGPVDQDEPQQREADGDSPHGAAAPGRRRLGQHGASFSKLGLMVDQPPQRPGNRNRGSFPFWAGISFRPKCSTRSIPPAGWTSGDQSLRRWAMMLRWMSLVPEKSTPPTLSRTSRSRPPSTEYPEA